MSENKVFAVLPIADSGTELAPSSRSNKLSDELARSVQEKGLVLNQDGYIQWYPQNPKHPRNWTGKRKAYNTAVILLLEFITYDGRRAAQVAKQLLLTHLLGALLGRPEWVSSEQRLLVLVTDTQ